LQIEDEETAMPSLKIDYKCIARHGYNVGFGNYFQSIKLPLIEKIRRKNEKINLCGFLDGLSGDAWFFYYSSDYKFESSYVKSKNPLLTLAEMLGARISFVWRIPKDEILSKIIDSLRKNRLVVSYLRFSDTFTDWIVIYDYNNNSDKFKVISYAGSITKDSSHLKASFDNEWFTLNSNPSRSKAYFYTFSVSPTFDASIEELSLISIENAVDILTQKTHYFENVLYSAGQFAYDAIIKDLLFEHEYEKMSKEELEKLSSWNGLPFLLFQRSRYSAYSFLEAIMPFFQGKELKNLEKAYEMYYNIIKLLKQYQERLSYEGYHLNFERLSPGTLIQKLKNFERRRDGVNILRSVKNFELDVIDYLERLL